LQQKPETNGDNNLIFFFVAACPPLEEADGGCVESRAFLWSAGDGVWTHGEVAESRKVLESA